MGLPYATPNCTVIMEAMLAQGFSVAFGVTNCRPIADSTTWSQHAWSNGVDIHAGSIAELDKVHTWLNARRNRFHIRVMLWRVKDHYDHIHVDPWPKGIGTPPCAGGKLEVKYEDGSIGHSFSVNTNVKDDEMILTSGDSGQGVRDYQGLLNRVVTPKLTVDGIYGAKTSDAVAAFQKAKGLDATGNIDGPTAGLLATYTKRFLDKFLSRGDKVTIS